MKLIGILLIIGGMLLLVFRGINFNEDNMLADNDQVEINKEENKTITWPLYASGIVVIAGLIIVVIGKKKSK